MYTVIALSNIAELRTRRGNTSTSVAATIMGLNYPSDEAYTVYAFDNTSTLADNVPEVVVPTVGDVTTGRWLKVDLSVLQGPQGVAGLQGIQGVQGLQGVPGTNGANGANGSAGVNAFGSPVSRTVALATAYQATDTSKPSVVTVTLQSTSSISLTGTSNNEGAFVIGPTNAVASGTGTSVGVYKNNLGGGLVVGLSITAQAANTYSVMLPAGWYFAVRQTAGTGLTVVSAFDQAVG